MNEMQTESAGLMKEKDSFFKETVKFAIIALLVVLPIRLYIAEPFIVNGASMFPTFETGEYLIVDELSYRFEAPKRGDVVIFRYPKDTSKYFIKRIIGLPGETLIIGNNSVTIKNNEHPEGVLLEEPYLKGVETFGSEDITLSNSEYFVMGDNRPQSSDSRSWGPLNKKYLIGRALVRLLPLQTIDLFPGEGVPLLK